MSVSHTVVSWIQVIGLIIGLDGFFFLSLSIFGKTSTPWSRALLPATGVGLGVLLVAQTDPLLVPSSVPSVIGWVIGLFFVVWTYIAASLGMTLRVSKDNQPSERISTFAIVGGISLATICYVIAAAVAVVQIVTGHLMGADARSFGSLTGMMLVGWSLAALNRLPRTFTEDRLQKVGSVLSAIAILTQFIPPVLDLLNVKLTTS